MGVSGTAYRTVLVAHILCAVGGFGAVVFNSVYTVQGRLRGTREALVINEANAIISDRWARTLIIATPILGVALVAISRGRWSFGQTWVWGSLALFAVMMAIAMGVLRPVEKKAHSLLGELSASTGGGCGPCGGNCGGGGGQSHEDHAHRDHESATAAAGGVATAAATTTAVRADSVGPAVLREKAARLRILEKRKASIEGVLNIGVVVLTYLMVFKPGA